MDSIRVKLLLPLPLRNRPTYVRARTHPTGGSQQRTLILDTPCSVIKRASLLTFYSDFEFGTVLLPLSVVPPGKCAEFIPYSVKH